MTNRCDHNPIPKEQIQQNIDQYGCFVVGVEPDHLPGFAYTIGLFQRYNHPEIISFGLKLELMHDLLNDACELIKKGNTFLPGQPYSGFLVDYDVQFLKVHPSYYPNYLNYVNWFYQHREYPALQMVWPDRQHQFPWDNQQLKFTQPLLDRNVDFKFYVERNLCVFTTSQVLDGKPILFVYHDENGDWQFHSQEEPDLNDCKVVSLESMTKMDPSINELYHIRPGGHASRGSKEENWIWD